MSIKGFDGWRLSSGPRNRGDSYCPCCSATLGRNGDYCPECGWRWTEDDGEGNEFDEEDGDGVE